MITPGCPLRSTLLILPLLCVSVAHGQYDPPADYYATVTGNPATLRDELHLIVSDDYWTSLTGPQGAFQPDGSGHRYVSYDDLRQALQIVDRDPDNPDNIILAYNGASVPGAWDNGATWNREHRWPASWGLGSSGSDYSDMHHLIACSTPVNSARGNLPYGTTTSTGHYGSTGSYWYPGDADVPEHPEFGDDTGDAARAMLYMALRYDGADGGTMDLEMHDGTEGQSGAVYYGGDLASALLWHYRDPPSQHERRRNHAIFSNIVNPAYYQGNRNPFIDHPEYVWAIFGDAANDSRLYVGDAPEVNGGSSIAIDFGTVAQYATVPAPRDIVLHKSGNDPTYFAVTVDGGVECESEGRFNGFVAGLDVRPLTIAFPADVTATAGLKTATLTIENLDITSDGAGTGSLDDDDTITVTLTVIGCGMPAADTDNDGDVDLSDFGAFQNCMTGRNDPGDLFDVAQCGCFDNDEDGDVDPEDFAVFQTCFTGPKIAADPSCAN